MHNVLYTVSLLKWFRALSVQGAVDVLGDDLALAIAEGNL